MPLIHDDVFQMLEIRWALLVGKKEMKAFRSDNQHEGWFLPLPFPHVRWSVAIPQFHRDGYAHFLAEFLSGGGDFFGQGTKRCNPKCD